MRCLDRRESSRRIEESIPLWNRVLEKKCLSLVGPVAQSELDLMLSSLSPEGLWFDVEIVPEDIGFESKWEWSHAEDRGSGVE